MTEGTPMTPEEFRQLNRDLMEKMIDKAASDPVWKQRLLDDPEAAMLEADFSEAQRLREAFAPANDSALEAEVAGHAQSGCQQGLCYLSAVYLTFE